MKAKKIWFDNSQIHLEINTGEVGSLPLKAFPRLYNATDEQRQSYSLSPMGIHWNAIDEDLSYEGFFYPVAGTKNEISLLFELFPEINVNQFARIMGVNQSLMAKYICGVATPSDARKQQIKIALQRLGQELLTITL